MPLHKNQISEKTKINFSEVRKQIKNVLERFYQAFISGLDDINRNWRDINSKDKLEIFEDVRTEAFKIMVNKEDGGEADDGITAGTFSGYVSKMKKAIEYDAPLKIAEKATTQELQKARIQALTTLKNSPCTFEEKMTIAFNDVKKAETLHRQQLKEQAEKLKNEEKKKINTSHTLPSPNQNDESEDVLNDGIKSILAWLLSKNLESHLNKLIEPARMLRSIKAELEAYENRMNKQPELGEAYAKAV